MKGKYKLLVINPGSTSTKMAVCESGETLSSVSIPHPVEELRAFISIWDQYDYRRSSILGELEKTGIDLGSFDCVVCRGGNTAPVPGGIYIISEPALEAMKSGKYGTHPTAVGNQIGFDLGRELGIPAVSCDPPVTDEMCESARFSGLPQIMRQSSFHALNQKATARNVAALLGRTYEEINMVVAHIGGGISVGAHKAGRIIDVNNALDGDGPFSPERAGTLPAGSLIDMCFSGRYTRQEMRRLITGGGGLVAHLGTSSMRDALERAANGDDHARAVCDAMIYQVIKEIGSMACVLSGKVDAIALTGSIVYSDYVVDYIKERVSFIAPIYIMPGQNEMDALRDGALRFLRGEEQAMTYEPGRGLEDN